MMRHIVVIYICFIVFTYARLVYKTTPNSDVMQSSQDEKSKVKIRKIRTVETTNRSLETSKEVFVKKPIPMFKESEDYQPDSSLRYLGPIEQFNEDDDFNIESYDFDVNNDNFDLSVPPVKLAKVSLESKSRDIAKEAPMMSKKVSRQVDGKIENEHEKEFFDNNTMTSESAFVGTDPEENMGKEAERYVRTVRSLWNSSLLMDKVEAKTTSALSKLLTYLPMFPKPPKDGSFRIW